MKFRVRSSYDGAISTMVSQERVYKQHVFSFNHPSTPLVYFQNYRNNLVLRNSMYLLDVCFQSAKQQRRAWNFFNNFN